MTITQKEAVEDTIAADSVSVQTSGGDALRPVDQVVLDLLRRRPGLTVTEFLELLEVTQTAVRIRLDRLESLQLIERKKVSVGRGRPVYQYHLTDAGWRHVGVTYADLASAIWSEIESIPNEEFRKQLLGGIAKRMGQAYALLLPVSSTSDRMDAMAKLLTQRKIPAQFNNRSSGSAMHLPVITVHACPFPDLAAVNRRSACELEQAVFSEAVGAPMELSCCRLDGHDSCQFRPATAALVAN
ncbi:MAG: MarR family transcriptional regulator [Planctomycetota bacterium]|nr:MarR family transcriptional regulator [Planctomycetota bacterium]